jgi:hypothetical protein
MSFGIAYVVGKKILNYQGMYSAGTGLRSLCWRHGIALSSGAAGRTGGKGDFVRGFLLCAGIFGSKQGDKKCPRKFFVGGNWKMNGDCKQIAALTKKLANAEFDPEVTDISRVYFNFYFKV